MMSDIEQTTLADLALKNLSDLALVGREALLQQGRDEARRTQAEEDAIETRLSARLNGEGQSEIQFSPQEQSRTSVEWLLKEAARRLLRRDWRLYSTIQSHIYLVVGFVFKAKDQSEFDELMAFVEMMKARRRNA